MKTSLYRRSFLFLASLAAAGLLPCAVMAQDTPQVKLNIGSAGPRAIEEQTARSLVRDYAAAWKTLDEAAEKSAPDLLNAYFTGAARTSFLQALEDQKITGAHIRYRNQRHALEAIFYAPEGDILQLQDTADYQFQVISGDKVLHEEHVIVRYIVLMTPGADRWVVRQLQAVPAS